MMFRKNTHKEIIFCVSFQRTGTTSTGTFFKDHGYKVGDWNKSSRNSWGDLYFKGDFQQIFDSKDFMNSEMFEDGPWFANDFYKYLFHHFPKSKFILLERDENKWFDSMLSHSNGMVLGNTHRHCVIYNREEEFYSLPNWKKHLYTKEVDNLLPLLEKHREHYTKIYRNRNREVKNFFESLNSERLFKGKLEDQNLWMDMGKYFGIKVSEGYKAHSNKTKNNG